MSTISLNDIKKGAYVVLEGEPYRVVDREHSAMQQRKAVIRLRLKNLKTRKVKDETMVSSSGIEEADIEKSSAIFIYERGGEYFFHETGNPADRFSLSSEVLSDYALYLKNKMEVETLVYEGDIIGITLPIKVEYEVVEAPPVIKSATAAGGTKQVKIETGAVISVPMFIETGDKIIVNTERGEYVSKA